MSVFRKIAVGELIFESAQDSIVAKAGGGQANAFQIGPVEMTRVTTVATAGDSIMLPPAQPGIGLIIVNHGAKTMQVFGQPGDTINDVATATGVPQMVNSWVFYGCFTAGAWYTEGLASGFASVAGAFATFSSQTGVVAHAGGGQIVAAGDPSLISAMQVQVSTVATGADSVTLPPAKTGMEITLVNNGANSMAVFPNTGDTINGGGANASVNQAAAAVTIYYCFVVGAWVTK